MVTANAREETASSE